MFKLYNFIYERLIRKMIPTPILRIPTLISRIPIIPNLIPRIPIIAFIPLPNFPLRLFQIASSRCTFQNLNSFVDLKFNLLL